MEYIHVVVDLGVERVMEDVSEKGENGCYSVEKDNPGNNQHYGIF